MSDDGGAKEEKQLIVSGWNSKFAEWISNASTFDSVLSAFFDAPYGEVLCQKSALVKMIILADAIPKIRLVLRLIDSLQSFLNFEDIVANAQEKWISLCKTPEELGEFRKLTGKRCPTAVQKYFSLI